jgi:hypothetical protein
LLNRSRCQRTGVEPIHAEADLVAGQTGTGMIIGKAYAAHEHGAILFGQPVDDLTAAQLYPARVGALGLAQ